MILVIEDNLQVLEAYQTHLAPEGRTVREARNYRQAISVDVDSLSLVVADGDLGEGPGRTGPRAVAELRQRGYAGPALICSGLDLEAEAAEVGAEYYSKSQFVDLFNRVHELLSAGEDVG